MPVLKRLIAGTFATVLMIATQAGAQDANAPIQKLLQVHGDVIAKSSRKTIGPAIDALANSGLPDAQAVLERWQAKEMWRNKDTGLFVFGEEIDRDTIRIFDFAGNQEIGEAPDKEFKQLKPNSGIRGMIGAALVQFQLNDPDPENRLKALTAIERDAEESHLAAVRGAIDTETDPDIKSRKIRTERLLTIQFGETDEERIEAINGFKGDLGVDVRAALNPLVATKVEVIEGEAPEDDPTIATVLSPGGDALSVPDAYDLLITARFVPPRISREDQRSALIENIVDAVSYTHLRAHET